MILVLWGKGARTRRSWGLVRACCGVIGWLPVIVTRMFRCRRPCHAFVRHLANPISHSFNTLQSFLLFPCYYKGVASRAIAHQVEHFLSSDSFEPSTHPSINPSINTFFHPSTHIISFLPSIHQATTNTYLVYVPVTCHLPITSHHAGSSFLPAKTPIGPQPNSSCDLHEVLPSLARDLTRHTPFITTAQSPRRNHRYVFFTST